MDRIYSYVVTPKKNKIGVAPANGRRFTNSELKGLLRCEELEYITTDDDKIMVIDAQGALRTNCRQNIIATGMHPFGHQVTVYGRALICSINQIKNARDN